MSTRSISIILRAGPDELEAVSRSLREHHPEVELDQGSGPDGPDLGLLFDYAPVALILVDTARRVLRINRMATSLAGQVPKDMLAQITGVAIGCANAHAHPDGCGHSGSCGQCGLKAVIEATFASGSPQRQVETTATFGAGQAHQERKLRVSTSLVELAAGRFGLLSLEEIREEEGLPTGSPGPAQLGTG